MSNVVAIGKHVKTTKKTPHREAFELLAKIKPNVDMTIVISVLEGVIEAQRLREKIAKDFFKKGTKDHD
jgi:hypothetical protein